jgi:hypothetical protein
VPTIISGILSFVASCIASYFSWCSICETKKGNEDNRESNEKISREVQEAENKRNESQIDANIVWNSRVEWIQNVRRVTAEFITDCYKYMRAYDNSSKESLNLVEEKKLLLILYFGPDGHGADLNKATNIFDAQTNNGKNDLIVNLINEIYFQIKKYYDASRTLEQCNKELTKCVECENGRAYKQYFCEKDEYGDKFSDDDCENCKEKIKIQEENSYAVISGLQENLEKLSEAMRIYLKIEWNNAKNRNKC